MDVIAEGTGKGPSNAMLFVDYLERQRVPYQWTPYEKKTATARHGHVPREKKRRTRAHATSAQHNSTSRRTKTNAKIYGYHQGG